MRVSGEEAEVPVLHIETAVISERRNARVRVEDGRVALDSGRGFLHAALVDRGEPGSPAP